MSTITRSRRIGVVFISDRGDMHLPDCQASFRAYVHRTGGIDAMRVVDDREHTLGMAGAVQAAWEWALADADLDYLFHVEEDFRFVRDIDLDRLAAHLERSPYLAQMCLLRQPWSPEERRHGSLYAAVEAEAPGTFRQMGSEGDPYTQWVFHKRLFSLNPCLIPRQVLALGWPSGPLGVGNEAGFTRRCLDVGYSFGYAGRLTDDPWVEHVGDTRAEGWRL